MKRLSILLLMILVMAPGISAQDATPVAVERDEISVVAGLPAPSDLGPGWALRISGEAEPFEDTESPRYFGQYVDQAGNRAFIRITLYGRSALDASVAYEISEDYVDDQDRQLGDSDIAPNNAQLDRIDAPDGCSDVLRAVGLDPLTLFPIGLTICVDEESQRVISVVASGEFDIDGRPVSYQEASDALMELVIRTIPA